MCAGSTCCLWTLPPCYSIGLGQVQVWFLSFIHLAFVGEEDLGLRAGREDRWAGKLTV